MSRLKLYHNARCSKSRGALELLNKEQIQVDIINYLETPPSVEELRTLLGQLQMRPEEIVRKGEDRFEELNLASVPLSDEQWLHLLCENPILIERPILTNGKRAVIGRPPERVLELLSKD